jgi:hypothetical protein
MGERAYGETLSIAFAGKVSIKILVLKWYILHQTQLLKSHQNL